MILQLREPIWLTTPRGIGLAHFVIDRGIEADLEWVTFIQETGECWTFQNSQIRACQNETIGRSLASPTPLEIATGVPPIPKPQG